MPPELFAEQLAVRLRGLLDPLALRVGSLEIVGRAWEQSLRRLESHADRVGERLSVLEAREPIPGPPGPPGRDGTDGKDGAPGPQGIPGLRYLGVHVAGKTYDVGDVVTQGGSAWYCGGPTTGTPGAAPAWQLMVKRGRDLREKTP